MNSKKNIKTVTYALYEDIFLQKEEDIDYFIQLKIKDFDPADVICFAAFLNMVCQTTDVNELINIQLNGKGRLFKDEYMQKFNKGQILFHRDNLLLFIIYAISQRISGSKKVTGLDITYNEDTDNFGKILLLINNKIGYIIHKDIEREIIKIFPTYFHPRIVWWFYNNRTIRYSYIYQKLLPETKEEKKKLLSKGIEIFENKYAVKLDDYFETLIFFLYHFVGVKQMNIDAQHFDPDKPNSFYLNKNQFKDSKYYPTLKALSQNVKGFYKNFKKARKDVIDVELFKYYQDIFDHPILDINDKFYVLDLKFLIENVCAGLFWKIDAIIKKNIIRRYSMQNIRQEYGDLLEKYFIDLMKKIFKNIKPTNNEKGQPDAVLKCSCNGKSYVLIFEFTTKPYKIASIYNKSSKSFFDDLERIFFSTKKNDRGKFINIENYLEEYVDDKITIIPILVTENWLGDFDLLNRIEVDGKGILDIGIKNNGLKNTEKHKPIILCLDDLETFWAISKMGKEDEEFIKVIESWKSNINKGSYLFNFANYVSDNKTISNDSYREFFNRNNLNGWD